jgi:uncharacterized protein YbjT (DUF2867 family)
MTQQLPILVLGATGKTGRRVIERLQARNLPFRAGSRSVKPHFDWNDPSTWQPVLQDVKSVYITFQPDLAVPGADDIIRTFTAHAASSGVQRLVLLSGRGEDQALACESIVQNSGLEWTIIRASWFNQNFNEGFLLDSIMSGEVILPVEHVLEPFIDADDIADLVVAALTEDRHTGQIYEVTGPRLMTFQQAINEIASATGRELQFMHKPIDEYVILLREFGVPEDTLWLMNFLFTTVLDGRNSSLTDDVQRALGRSPRDFADYVHETAATGVWSVAAPSAMAANGS